MRSWGFLSRFVSGLIGRQPHYFNHRIGRQANAPRRHSASFVIYG
jgi:hypothetical protein